MQLTVSDCKKRGNIDPTNPDDRMQDAWEGTKELFWNENEWRMTRQQQKSKKDTKLKSTFPLPSPFWSCRSSAIEILRPCIPFSIRDFCYLLCTYHYWQGNTTVSVLSGAILSNPGLYIHIYIYIHIYMDIEPRCTLMVCRSVIK